MKTATGRYLFGEIADDKSSFAHHEDGKRQEESQKDIAVGLVKRNRKAGVFFKETEKLDFSVPKYRRSNAFAMIAPSLGTHFRFR